MRQIIVLGSALMIALILEYSCKIGQRVGAQNEQKRLVIEHIDSSLLNRGYYMNGKKAGIWYSLKNDTIQSSIEYFENDSTQNIICYYFKGSKVSCETTVYFQTIDFEVLDTTRFYSNKEKFYIERIGFDLFIFTCSDCHKTNSYKNMVLNLNHETPDKLSFFLSNDKRHQGAHVSLNKYEIIGISEYLNGLRISDK